MKGNRNLIIILVILSVISVFFIFKRNNSTLKKELSEFAVKDTASITKIFLADRNNHSITLERKNASTWLLNGRYSPRPEFLKLLLETIFKVEVKSRIANAAYNNVLKSLASSGIKCEIYLGEGKEPFKVYYVGGQTENSEGTFMMLENSSMPFIMEISGFQGYLTPRYSVDIDAWRSTILFETPVEKIKSVSVTYSNYPDKSFTINSNKKRYTIEQQSTKNIIKSDTIALENYLRLFQKIYFEGWARNLPEGKKDSLIAETPSIKITLVNVNEEKKEVAVYPMPISEKSLTKVDESGKPLLYDLDRMFGYIKPDSELVILQHYSFDVLLRQLSDFKSKQ